MLCNLDIYSFFKKKKKRIVQKYFTVHECQLLIIQILKKNVIVFVKNKY